MRAHRFLTLAAAAALSACGPKVASIDADPASLTLTKKGETAKLSATPKTSEGEAVAGLSLAYTSSAPAVATVDGQGTVTAVATGDAVVKVAFEDKAVKEVPVRVSIPSSVSISPGIARIDGLGRTLKLTARVLDSKGRQVPVDISWESPNPAQVVVDAHGLVTSVGGGSGQVFAIAAGIRAPVTVTVIGEPVDKLEAGKALKLKVGAEQKLAPLGKSAKGEPVLGALFTFSSADPSIAAVGADGLVKGLAAGKTKLTVTSGDKSATVDVTVTK